MKSLKQTKILFGFGLSMMDKAIEMQNAKNKFQELKNEEIRLQSTQIKGEILELKSPFNEDEPIDEKDDCDCPACVLRRTLEGKERGFND